MELSNEEDPLSLLLNKHISLGLQNNITIFGICKFAIACNLPLFGNFTYKTPSSLTINETVKTTAINENNHPPKKRLSYRVMQDEEKEPIDNKDDDNDKVGSSSNNDKDEKKRKKSVDYYSKGIKRQKRLPSSEYASAVTNRQYSDATTTSNDDVRIVIVKKLEISDVNPQQARLSIPRSQCRNKFLSNKEEKFLEKVDEYNRKCKIPVKVRGCNSAKAHNMFLTRWNYPESGYRYVLNGSNPSWDTVRRECGLEEGDEITVVAYRSKEDGCLCFAIERAILLMHSPTWGRKGRRSYPGFNRPNQI